MKVLAFDMGATSIRGVIGTLENETITLKEVMRFNHKILEKDGRKYWDWDNLIKQIEKTVLDNHKEIDSIAVDTWGVDYGIINEDGNLLESPTSYRDEGCMEGFESIKEKISLRELFFETGNQIMPINTLFQLESKRLTSPDLIKNADKLLMIPDLVNYFLTGRMYGEKTICSTSQMFDLEKGDWNYELVDKLGFEKKILAKIIDNKTVVGNLKNSKIKSLNKFDIDVISVASHDTASAVYVTESYTDKDTLFLSSGTWSLMGACVDKVVINEDTYGYNLTNETGYNSKNMLFKNITGLYLIEKLIDSLEKKYGKRFTYEEINKIVEDTAIKKAYIDVEEEVFALESDDFINDLDEYLEKTNQSPIDDKKDYFRIIYESLVRYYKTVLKQVEECSNRKFKRIHIIGGGSQSELLCQMIADELSLDVIAGPKEATALGNVMSQLEHHYGEEKSSYLRKIVEKSFKLKKYYPVTRN